MSHNFQLCNLDTDSISFCKKDGSSFSEEEQKTLLSELNSLYPEKIRWEHDGVYPCVVVLKAKNYILYDGKAIKIKGSSLRSSKTEKALKAFIDEMVTCLVHDRSAEVVEIYHKYVNNIKNIQDITPWCSKKTITASVVNPTRTNEEKVLEALGDASYQMGDKCLMYFAKGGKLKLSENWDGHDHDEIVLLKKLYKTALIFSNVIPASSFQNYALKGKHHLLKLLLWEQKIAKEIV